MSEMIPIQYIGKKDVHVDVLFGTGLQWRRSEVQEVPREIAEMMMMHPDVYRDARAAAVRRKDPLKPRMREIKNLDREREEPAVNFAYMNKEALARFNERMFGERLDPEKMTASAMRQRILSNMRLRI